MKEILDLQVSNGWFGAIIFLHIIHHALLLPKRSFVDHKNYVLALSTESANKL